MIYRYYRFISWPGFACIVTALALGLLMLGPFMRSPEQAGLLDGGLMLSKGLPQVARAEFHFDKQFISCGLLGALDHFLPKPVSPDTLVLAGNLFGFIFFWVSLLILIARSGRRLSAAAFLPLLLTPVFLNYSAFYTSPFISAAFLFLLAVHLNRIHWNVWKRAGVFVLAFAAVGARVDALLVLPLLAMLHSPQRNLASAIYARNTWLLAAGGVAAFIAGRAMSLSQSVDGVGAGFHPKPTVGYLIFGVGATGLLLLVSVLALLRAGRQTRRSVWMVYTAFALLLPALFYCLQLKSPRHCALLAVAAVIFACARRGRALFETALGGGMKTILVLAALVPVFLGVNLAEVRHPKLTFLRPTLLPSPAGVAPTGAWLAFALSVKPERGFLDHHHAVWSALRDAGLRPDNAGSVPYLFTPMEPYFKLAIHLQNEVPRRCYLDNLATLAPSFYCESRSLMHMQQFWQSDLMVYLFSKYNLQPAVRQDWHGVTLLRALPNPQPVADPFSGALWALNQSFEKDEFRIESILDLKKIPATWAGKKITLASTAEFKVKSSLSKTGRMLCGGQTGCWHLIELPVAIAGESIEVPATGDRIYVGVGVNPAWMTLNKK